MKVLIFIVETRGRGLGNLVELNYQILQKEDVHFIDICLLTLNNGYYR